MVPFSTSAPAIVSGIRSESLSTRTITKCPARRLRAISGASTTISATFSEKKRLLMIAFIVLSSICGCKGNDFFAYMQIFINCVFYLHKNGQLKHKKREIALEQSLSIV